MRYRRPASAPLIGYGGATLVLALGGTVALAFAVQARVGIHEKREAPMLAFELPAAASPQPPPPPSSPSSSSSPSQAEPAPLPATAPRAAEAPTPPRQAAGSAAAETASPPPSRPDAVLPQVLAVPAPPPASAPDTGALRDAYAARLWRHIAARRPAGIRLSGTVVLQFDVDAAGRLSDLGVRTGSGNAMLDRLALRAVQRAAPLPPPPSELAGALQKFTIPFSFE
jgi:protein TonB